MLLEEIQALTIWRVDRHAVDKNSQGQWDLICQHAQELVLRSIIIHDLVLLLVEVDT